MKFIKRLGKAMLKVALFITLLLVLNFILDLICSLASWIPLVLLILTIIGLVVMYYFTDK